jgi:hypothetical protein
VPDTFGASCKLNQVQPLIDRVGTPGQVDATELEHAIGAGSRYAIGTGERNTIGTESRHGISAGGRDGGGISFIGSGKRGRANGQRQTEHQKQIFHKLINTVNNSHTMA